MATSCVGILSPGDMAMRWARSSSSAASPGQRLAERSELTRSRAERAGIEDAGDLDGVVSAAEGILAILPPAEAEPSPPGRGGDAAAGGCPSTPTATRSRPPPRVGSPKRSPARVLHSSTPGSSARPPAKRPDTRFYASGPMKWLEGSPAAGAGGITVIGLGEEIGRASAI